MSNIDGEKMEPRRGIEPCLHAKEPSTKAIDLPQNTHKTLDYRCCEPLLGVGQNETETHPIWRAGGDESAQAKGVRR